MTVMTVPTIDRLVSSLSGTASTDTLHMPSKLNFISAVVLVGFITVTAGSPGSMAKVCKAVERNDDNDDLVFYVPFN